MAIDIDKIRQAQTVPCPWCHARSGTPCVTLGARGRPAGGYHPTRLEDAQKASTP
jgi:hypothetical protein